MFTLSQFESAIQKFIVSEPRLTARYQSDAMVSTIAKRMLATSLPSTTAASIAFNDLVKEGKLIRTDGKNAADDQAEYQDEVNQLVASCIAKDQEAQLERWEIEWFASMGPREISERFYENGGLNKFNHRYSMALAQHGFKTPEVFKARS
jgi:hypothetical protein